MTAHVVPVMTSDQEPHELGAGACWCQPVIENDLVRDISGGSDNRLVIHRRFIDGPARDPDDTNDGNGWAVIRVGDDELPTVRLP